MSTQLVKNCDFKLGEAVRTPTNEFERRHLEKHSLLKYYST